MLELAKWIVLYHNSPQWNKGKHSGDEQEVGKWQYVNRNNKKELNEKSLDKEYNIWNFKSHWIDLMECQWHREE